MLAVLAAGSAMAQNIEPVPAEPVPGVRLVGDIGLGVSVAPVPMPSQTRPRSVVPYANFDVGPWFARIDTFGVKLAPCGDGHIELLTRVLDDGYTAATPPYARRRASVPLGLGTLQVTPVGAWMVNVYRDLGRSHATLADLMVATELVAGRLTLYPQMGLEYRSARYVREYDDVAHATTQPFAGLLVEWPLGGRWYAIANVRRSWLDDALRSNRLVRRGTLDSALVAFSYRYD